MSDEGTSKPAKKEVRNTDSKSNLLNTEDFFEVDSYNRMGKSKGKVMENGCISSDSLYNPEMFLQVVEAVSDESEDSCGRVSHPLSFKEYVHNEINSEPSTSGRSNFYAQAALVEVASPLQFVHRLSNVDDEDDDDDGDFDTSDLRSKNQPSHTRSLSQTTTQLNNLKELAHLESDRSKDLNMSSDKVPNISSNRKSLDIRSVRTFRTLSFSEDDDNLKRVETTCDLNSTPDLIEIQRLESKFGNIMCDPGWKLDRRDSGHLYWRRDSASLPDPSCNRVKFRYDIEVCEFENRSSTGEEEITEDDEDELLDATNLITSESQTEETIPPTVENSFPSTVLVSVVAVIGIIVTATYGWIMDTLRLI